MIKVPKASRLETREEPMFYFKVKSRKRLMSQLRQSGRRSFLLLEKGSGFLFYSGLQLTGLEPLIREAIRSTWSTDSKVNLIRKCSHRHTQSNVWPKYLGTSWHNHVNT